MGQQCGLGFAGGASVWAGPLLSMWSAVGQLGCLVFSAPSSCSMLPRLVLGAVTKKSVCVWDLLKLRLRVSTFSLLPHSVVREPQGQPRPEGRWDRLCLWWEDTAKGMGRRKMWRMGATLASNPPGSQVDFFPLSKQFLCYHLDMAVWKIMAF